MSVWWRHVQSARVSLAGTNPTNAVSAFRITSAMPTNNDVRVDWTTVGGCSYVMQAVTNANASRADKLVGVKYRKPWNLPYARRA